MMLKITLSVVLVFAGHATGTEVVIHDRDDLPPPPKVMGGHRTHCLDYQILPSGDVVLGGTSKFRLSVFPANPERCKPDTLSFFARSLLGQPMRSEVRADLATDGSGAAMLDLELQLSDTCMTAIVVHAHSPDVIGYVAQFNVPFYFVPNEGRLDLYYAHPSQFSDSVPVTLNGCDDNSILNNRESLPPLHDSDGVTPDSLPDTSVKRGKSSTYKIQIDSALNPIHKSRVADPSLDSIRRYIHSLPDTAKVEVCLDLREDNDRLLVQDYVGTLYGEQVEPGFFHMHLTKAQRRELRSKGIRTCLVKTSPHVHAVPPADRSAIQGTDYDKSSSSVFFYEGFSNDHDWKNSFDSWDASDDVECQEDTWGTNGFAGYIWCAGEGSQAWGTWHDCNQHSFLQSRNIDGTSLFDQRISIRCRIDLWDVHTHAYLFVTGDPYDWPTQPHVHWTSADNTAGWEIFTSDMPWDYVTPHFQIVFSSGFAINYDEGFSVDWVFLEGSGPPNLTPHTPEHLGWSSPIIMSRTFDWLQDETLYEGEDQFFHFCWANLGYSDAAPHDVYFLIDDQAVNSGGVIDYLEPGLAFIYKNMNLSLGAGQYTIRMVVDSLGLIEEVHEDDNDFSRAFSVESSEIEYSGAISYVNDLTGSTVWVDGIRIEMWDYDEGEPELLDVDFTNWLGEYSLGPVPAIEGAGGDRQDIFFRIYAESMFESCYAKTNTNPGRHILETPPSQDHIRGTFDSTFNFVGPEAGAFFAVQMIDSAWREWRDLTGLTPPEVKVLVLPGEGVQTGYSSDEEDAFIVLRASHGGLYSPDDFDPDIIWHEYGHHLAFSSGTFDYGPEVLFVWDWHTDHFVPNGDNLVAREAWAIFWACYLTNSSIWYDRGWGLDGEYDFVNYDWWNLEDGTWGRSRTWQASETHPSVTHMGLGCPGAVTGVFWDLYDDVVDDQNSDLFKDEVTFPMETILSICLDSIQTPSGTVVPDDMEELWESSFRTIENRQAQEMIDMYYEHGIDYYWCGCCMGIRGDVNGDGQDVLVDDIVYAVSFMFQGGPEPHCLRLEPDVNSSPGLCDIADLVYMIAYAWVGGPDPLPCKVDVGQTCLKKGQAEKHDSVSHVSANLSPAVESVADSLRR